jgi:dTMP kinase
MTAEKLRGKIIVIEGSDGCGKTTQIDKLKNFLEDSGESVKVFDFPRYGEKSAVLVEEYLNGNFGSAKDVGAYRASIFYACDRYAASFDIRKAIEEKSIILCNRYTTANMLHQAGKISDLKERKKFLKWLVDLEFNVFNIPKPDHVIFLYLDIAISSKLATQKQARHENIVQSNDIHEKDINHLKDATDSGLWVSKIYKWIVINCQNKNKEIITIEKIHKKIVKKLDIY